MVVFVVVDGCVCGGGGGCGGLVNGCYDWKMDV